MWGSAPRPAGGPFVKGPPDPAKTFKQMDWGLCGADLGERGRSCAKCTPPSAAAVLRTATGSAYGDICFSRSIHKPPSGREVASAKRETEGECGRIRKDLSVHFRALPQTAFGPGRKHSLLPALAKNMPPAYFLKTPVSSRRKPLGLVFPKKGSPKKHNSSFAIKINKSTLLSSQLWGIMMMNTYLYGREDRVWVHQAPFP